MIVTRFAPSPTGYLHLGHAYSALFARDAARNGVFLLRIEDIDPMRCKPEYADAIIEDLRWLGLTWPDPVRRQSQHMDDYGAALDRLRGMGVLYPCFCTRGDVARDAAQAAAAPHADDGILIYPGTCRSLSVAERAEKTTVNQGVNWRLDIAAALEKTGALWWLDHARGEIEARPHLLGDVVLARKDMSASYHLCVTVDDHLQGVTFVTRGEDLFLSTHIHRLLQALLGYDTPDYWHHRLVTDRSGRRYAKRDQSATLRSLREQGWTPSGIKQEIYRK